MSDPTDTAPEELSIIGSKSLDQWDAEWVLVEGGFNVLHTKLNHTVGLYRADLAGNIMVIGQATESQRGGLRKRLADFRRPSWSARNHSAGWYIYTNRADLELWILPTGSDRKAEKVAADLKGPMIARHKPLMTFG